MTDDTLQYVIEHPTRLLLYTALSALGWLIAAGIRTWYRDWSSRLCRGGHKKKYVELKYYTNYNCNNHFKIHTPDEWWATVCRWICEEKDCPKSGWDCFGTTSWWMIEHGKVVPDKKKMESPPTDLGSPKDAVRKQKGEPKELTFDDVFKAAEQAMLKNMSKMTEQIGEREGVVQKQSMCDCGCECDPQFVAGVGELPRPKCDPLRHPQHHDIDVVLSAKKKWAENQKHKGQST